MSDQTSNLADLRTQLRDLAVQRDWQALLDHARPAREAHPDMWEPAYYEARALVERGRYEEADHLLQLGMDRFPRLPQFAVLYGQSGMLGLSHDDAIARWRSIVPRTPDTPAVFTGLAQAYRVMDRNDEADRVIADGLAAMPGNLVLMAYRAECAAQRKDWTAALAYWSAVRDLAPQRADAATGTLLALRQLDRLEEAEALGAAAQAQFPTDPRVWTSLAMVAAANEDWPLAEQRWRHVVELAPDNIQAALGLARALTRQSRRRDADYAVLAAMQRHPDNPQLMMEYARSSFRARSWAESVERWQAVYERCPPSADIYLEYANALWEAEQYLEAEEMTAEGVGFAPNDLKLLIKHADLAVRRLDYPEAMRRWQYIAKRFPDDPMTIAGLADIKAKVEEAKKMKVLDRALPKQAGPQGSLKLPDKPKLPDRIPQMGPTALDLLLTGAPAGDMALPPAPPKGLEALRGKLRTLFGRK